MITKAMINKVRTWVSDILSNENSGHGAVHTLRVEELSRKFAAGIGSNPEKTALIALLHDVDDYKVVGEKQNTEQDNARKILEFLDLKEEERKEILAEIRSIGYDRRLEGIVPWTREGRAVSDADMCDAMGANGILRLQQYALNHGGTFFDKDRFPVIHQDPDSYREARFDIGKICVCHIFDKILKLKDFMLTESGKAEAEKRHAFTVSFLYQLFEEEQAPEWTVYLDDYLAVRW